MSGSYEDMITGLRVKQAQERREAEARAAAFAYSDAWKAWENDRTENAPRLWAIVKEAQAAFIAAANLVK